MYTRVARPFLDFSEGGLGTRLQQSIIEDPDETSAHFSENHVHAEVSFDAVMIGETPQLERSECDIQEDERVREFLSDTCGCHLGVGNQACCLAFSSAAIRKCRNSYSELSHNELDLVVMSQVHYLRTTEDQVVERSTSSDSFRPVSAYYFQGVRICQATFLFLHHISRNRYLRITELYTKEGLTVSEHGNSGKLPKHSCTFEQVEEVKRFIENYARAHGLPVPGRLPNAKNKVLLLPSDLSKMFVFRKYEEAASHPVRKSKFLALWSQLTPHVAVMKPASDLCFICQQNNQLIMKAVNMPDVVRKQRYDNASQHLELARAGRYYYREQCNEAEASWKAHLDDGSCVNTMHYSYDFAQQVHFPFDSQQTGPAYFKTARKCGIFGVCCEGKGEQVNYLIDEAENPGKGADYTISLVHHYIETYGCSEQNIRFHADNCTGQNKNNANVQYLL